MHQKWSDDGNVVAGEIARNNLVFFDNFRIFDYFDHVYLNFQKKIHFYGIAIYKSDINESHELHELLVSLRTGLVGYLMVPNGNFAGTSVLCGGTPELVR